MTAFVVFTFPCAAPDMLAFDVGFNRGVLVCYLEVQFLCVVSEGLLLVVRLLMTLIGELEVAFRRDSGCAWQLWRGPVPDPETPPCIHPNM